MSQNYKNGYVGDSYSVHSHEQRDERWWQVDETVLQMDQRNLCCGSLSLRHGEERARKTIGQLQPCESVDRCERSIMCY